MCGHRLYAKPRVIVIFIHSSANIITKWY